MKTCILLSYKGLGSNLLHLSYCHEIAKKYGPITSHTCGSHSELLVPEHPTIYSEDYKFTDHKVEDYLGSYQYFFYLMDYFQSHFLTFYLL